MKNRGSIGGVVLFVVYIIVLADVLFLVRGITVPQDFSFLQNWRFHTNLKPFLTIRSYLHMIERYGISASGRIYWRNLAGNLVLFLPMGYFLPRLFPWFGTFFRTVLFTVFMIVCVEAAQLVTQSGSCDVDDLILNTVGCVLGHVIYKLLSRIKGK